jgi:hypothetical protein
MATRSTITRKNKEGNFESIYVHFDGQPSSTGYILQSYYTNDKQVEELVKLGNLSYVDKKAKPSDPKNHSFRSPERDTVVAYGRDRGEKNQEATIHRDIKSIEWQQYNYYWDGSEWHLLNQSGHTTPLRKLI